MYDIEGCTDIVHAFLLRQTAAVGEYELIQLLDAEGVFAPVKNFSASLQLFHKHFLTMHCLYKLKQRLHPQYLDVGALSIRLHKTLQSNNCGSEISNSEADLSEYYLGLENLYSASDDSVNQLLQQFWQRFEIYQGADDAYQVLGLNIGASWREVKLAYRKQAQLNHPDKGGCPRRFAATQSAYQTLKQRLGV